MTKPRVKIKHPKRRGEWAEMLFMAMAAENGLEVTKPFGEMARYDFIVEHEGKFARVQVKSTIRRLGRGYACTMRGWRDPYRRNEFDFVAVYLVLEDLWYIIPAKHVFGKWSIALCPHSRKAKYDVYREAWHLLRGDSAKSGRVRSIQACAEEQTVSHLWEGPDFSRAAQS
ncbi:MAG: group I intron-associated PD-(D/E)XK endonuclease, partial [Terriglobales bacterium]